MTSVHGSGFCLCAISVALPMQSARVVCVEIVVGDWYIFCVGWGVYIILFLFSPQSKHIHKEGFSPPLRCVHSNKGCGSNPLVSSPTVYRLLECL